jgi:hypothetical protein
MRVPRQERGNPANGKDLKATAFILSSCSSAKKTPPLEFFLDGIGAMLNKRRLTGNGPKLKNHSSTFFLAAAPRMNNATFPRDE